MERAKAWSAQWSRLRREEELFLKSHEEAAQPLLGRALQGKVPAALQESLQGAFAKAFALIFEKGASVLEKTYSKEAIERRASLMAYDISLKQTRRSLRAPTKKAGFDAWVNALVSGAQGVGLGLLGLGLPDVPLFVGMLLRGMYETSLHYGYAYEGEKERYFILLLIETSLSRGEALREGDLAINRFIEQQTLPGGYLESRRIRAAAAALSDEVLYLKFLQGIPVAGAVGGACNTATLRRVLSYACLKYQRRLLRDLRREPKA